MNLLFSKFELSLSFDNSYQVNYVFIFAINLKKKLVSHLPFMSTGSPHYFQTFYPRFCLFAAQYSTFLRNLSLYLCAIIRLDIHSFVIPRNFIWVTYPHRMTRETCKTKRLTKQMALICSKTTNYDTPFPKVRIEDAFLIQWTFKVSRLYFRLELLLFGR